jgi:hypothetical protein
LRFVSAANQQPPYLAEFRNWLISRQKPATSCHKLLIMQDSKLEGLAGNGLDNGHGRSDQGATSGAIKVNNWSVITESMHSHRRKFSSSSVFGVRGQSWSLRRIGKNAVLFISINAENSWETGGYWTLPLTYLVLAH